MCHQDQPNLSPIHHKLQSKLFMAGLGQLICMTAASTGSVFSTSASKLNWSCGISGAQLWLQVSTELVFLELDQNCQAGLERGLRS